MPIYEYRCPQCGHVFEEMVSLSQAHGEEACPRCGTASPRMISHTSFVLKGGGWYVSDYGYRKGIKEEGASSSPTVSPAAGGDGAAAAATPASGAAAPAAAPAASPQPTPSA